MTPLETRPKTVACVALGPSSRDYFNATAKKKDRLYPDEVWTCNTAGIPLRADKHFIMDDLDQVKRKYPEWAGELHRYGEAIITCKEYEDWPNAFAFPLQEVMDSIKDDLFTTSAAYMIAYAIHIRVDTLYLFGVDFEYPGSAAVESGKEACAFLLGIARERGVNFRIPHSSTLLDSHMVNFDDPEHPRRPLYGYDYNPGESAERVARGVGTDLDRLVAPKCPVIDKGLKNMKEQLTKDQPVGLPPPTVNQGDGEAHA